MPIYYFKLIVFTYNVNDNTYICVTETSVPKHTPAGTRFYVYERASLQAFQLVSAAVHYQIR